MEKNNQPSAQQTASSENIQKLFFWKSIYFGGQRRWNEGMKVETEVGLLYMGNCN